MYATTGGSGGITTDPGPQTGKEEEEKMRLKTSSEQTRREKTVVTRLLQEIRRYEAGEGEGQEREYSKIPILECCESGVPNKQLVIASAINNKMYKVDICFLL